MSQRSTEDDDFSVPRREQQPSRGHDAHREAVERLLWTPTEGQDLTKSYFPLSDNSDDSD